VENIAEEIRGGAVELVRIGASDVILRDHLPEIMQRIRNQFPTTKLVLRSGYQPDLLQWMQKQELDVALTLLDKNIPNHFQSLPIIRLPLVLMVSRKSKLRNLEDLWKQKRITEPLLCLPPNEMICRNFQEGLRRLGVEWKVTIELSSLELIEAYVENEYGFGVGLELPGRKFSRKVRTFTLESFPQTSFGVIWQGKPTRFVDALIQETQRRAHLLGKSPLPEKSIAPESKATGRDNHPPANQVAAQ
jgi:DNA-binding transcriptional LysR family regulator